MSTTTNYTSHKIDDVTYYVFTVNIANQGFHQITLNNNIATTSPQNSPTTQNSTLPPVITTQSQSQSPSSQSPSTSPLPSPSSSSPPPQTSTSPSPTPSIIPASSTNPPVASSSSPQPAQSSSPSPQTQPASSPQPSASPSSTKPTVPPAATSTTTYFTTTATPGFASQRHLPWSTTVISLLAALLCIFACR